MITIIGQPASEPGRFCTLSFCFGFLSGDRKKMKDQQGYPAFFIEY